VTQRQELCHFLLWKLRSFMSTNEESHCSNYTSENTFYLRGHANKTFACCLWRYMKTQGPAKCKKRHVGNLCNEFSLHCTEISMTSLPTPLPWTCTRYEQNLKQTTRSSIDCTDSVMATWPYIATTICVSKLPFHVQATVSTNYSNVVQVCLS